MLPALNVQQFIHRIAIRQPRGPFLVGSEKIAMLVECERASESNPSTNCFPRFEVSAQPLNGAVGRVDIVSRASRRSIHEIRVCKIGAAQPKVDRTVLRIDREPECPNGLKNFRPAFRDHFLLISPSVPITVHNEGNLSFARDEHTIAARIALLCDFHSDRPAQRLVCEKQLAGVFETVAVGIAQQINGAVVAEGNHLAVMPVANVVEVPDF